MRNKWWLLAGVVVLVGCKQEPPAPTQSSAAASGSAASSAAASATAASGGKNADGSVSAPKKGDRPKFVKGAWARYASYAKDEQKLGEYYYSVQEVSGNDIVVESSVSGKLAMVVRAGLHIGDMVNHTDIKLKDIQYRIGGGPIKKVNAGAGSPYQAVWDQMFNVFKLPDFDKLPRQDVTVKAGTFRQTYKWTSTVSFMGISSTQTIYTHPAVSPPAYVKMTTTQGETFELLEYGSSGAKTFF